MDQLLPEWAQPFASPDEANEYWDLVCEVAAARWGEAVTCNYLFGTVMAPGGAVAHIDNLARDAVHVRSAEVRRRGLYGFFSMMDDHRPDRLAEQLADWEWVRPRVRTRLMGRFDAGIGHVSRSLDRRTDWVLALDLTTGCMPVGADVAEAWPMSRNDLWDLGHRQAVSLPARRATVWLDPVVTGFDGNLFTSGLVGDLTGRLTQPIGPLGALVTAPVAHRLYVVPLRSPHETPEAVVRLMSLSILDQETEPNRLSSSILWYRGPGRLQPGLSLGKDGIAVHLDEPLRSALDGRPGPAAA